MQVQIAGGNRYLRAQFIHRQPLVQHIAKAFIHVQQNVFAIGDQKEIGHIFALRRQQGGIDRALVQFADVIGHDSLQKVAGVGAGEAQNAARGHAGVL